LIDMNLYVHFDGRTVASIEGDGPVDRLVYQADFLGHSSAFPLSPCLPLQLDALHGKPVQAFFENLLPEGRIRDELFDALRLTSGDIMGFLRARGLDLPGGLVITEDDTPPSNAGTLNPISPQALLQRIEDAQEMHQPVMPQGAARLSLAGAQEKLGICIDEQGYAIPNGVLSTHIIKPDSIYYPSLAVNEFLMMNMAGSMGLSVPAILYDTVLSAFVIERHDRKRLSDGTIKPIHQVDFCQALGLFSHEKYDVDGGHLKRMLAVTSETRAPLDQARKLFQRIVFDALIGNRDGHLKNFALIHDGQGFVMAPAYDLVCTDAFPGLARSHAIALGGIQDADVMDGEALVQSGMTLGLGSKYAARVVDDMIEMIMSVLPKTVEDVQHALPESLHDPVESIGRIVRMNVLGLMERTRLHQDPRSDMSA